MPTTTTPRMPTARLALRRPGGPGSSGGSASPTATAGPTASEVKLARVGGVAGYQDVLAVAPDGRITASVDREGTTIDLGEAADSDPLSTAAREVLDDVQLPEAQRTVCR